MQTRHFPLAFGYLKSYAEANGVKFESAYLETGDDAEAYDVLKNFCPSVVALTSITENYGVAMDFAAFVRGIMPHVKIVIGGVHISAVPDSLSPNMNIGVVGEGEQTFLELLRAFFRPSPSINGLVYWDNGRLVQTPRREPIANLDDIPRPKRDIFYVGTDVNESPRQSYIFTSRGCPFGCRFCSSSAFWGKTRFHSPRYVADEIFALRDSGVKEIVIFDDCFILDVKRVREIRDLVKGSGVAFTVAARANLVTDEVADLLKSMGVVRVGMGLESNSPAVLAWLGKNGNTPEINQHAVDILKRHGLAVGASFIRGTPIETKQDLKLTFDFIDKNDLAFDMYELMRFPNTPLYEGSRKWSECQVRTYRRPFINRAFRFARRNAEKFLGVRL